MNKIMIRIAAFCFAAGLSSCDSMHDLHLKYLESGEDIYAPKVDSISPGPGNKRIEMEVFISAQRIDFIRFFWDARADSFDYRIDNRTGMFKVMIENLEEREYLFEIVSFDKFGNRSLSAEVSSIAYGESYQSFLTNRGMASINYNTAGDLVIEWTEPADNAIFTTLYYTDKNGNGQTIVTPASESVTVIPDLSTSVSEYRYMTSYAPAKNSPDIFNSEETTGAFPVFERMFDKSKFRALSIEGDTRSEWGWVLSNVFDGNANTGFHSPEVYADPPMTEPGWVTLDMGVTGKITRIRMQQRKNEDQFIFAHYNPRRFEIWGANDAGNLADWDVWTRLMECESIKPSGLPLGQLSNEDKALVNVGEFFACPPGVPAVRYLRVRVLENWSGGYNFNFMEIDVYGDDR